MGGNSLSMSNYNETDIFLGNAKLPNPQGHAKLKSEVVNQLYGNVIQPSPPRVSHKGKKTNEQWQEWMAGLQGG